jgi:transposase
VNPLNGDIVTHLADRLTQDRFIAHLQQILNRFPTKEITLFSDNYPTHNTPKVQAFLLANHRLKIISMPKYSPKLNMMENIWKELKNVVGNWFYSTIAEMERAITKFFRSLWHNKQKVLSLISFNKKYSI